MTAYRIRIALIALVVGFALGWKTPIWAHKHVTAEGIDGRIAACLRQPYE